jgi:hypothetical protein
MCYTNYTQAGNTTNHGEQNMKPYIPASYRAIDAAMSDINHKCDGPVTHFVAICRAMDLAAAGKHNPADLAEALYMLLSENDDTSEKYYN